MASPATESIAETLGSPEATACPECGQAVTHGQTQGLCPVCLMELAQRPLPPNVPPEPLPVFGDYELLEKIDEGGMGVVYRARQRRLNRLVAVKMIRTGRAATESDMHRFRIEAAAAATLDHPNILPVFEFADHDGLLFYSMKLVEGETLARQIQERRWLPGAGDAAARQRRLAELMSLLAHAVHHAHQRGVLHRDLKPGNILLDGRGTPYLMDFGLAKLIESETEWTHTSAVLGTFGYMAPEQVAGTPGLPAPAVDVYGLGAILYALLTGRAPFTAEAPFLMLLRAVECDPVPPRQLNPVLDSNLETICLKCLEKDPRRRYASAKALAEDLGHWQRDEPINARPVGVWERGLKWARRHRGPVLGSLAAGVLLALGLIGFVWQRAAARQRAELNHLQRVEARFAQDDAALAVATLARLNRQDPANRMVAERLLNALAQHSFLVPAGPLLPSGAHLARWSSNGRILLLACIEARREAIQLLDCNRQPGVFLQPAPGDTHAADLSSDGRLVAVASAARVRVWDTQVSLQEPILDQASPTGLVRQVQLLSNRGVLVLAGDRVVRWDLPPEDAGREYRGGAALLTQIAVASESNWLAAATDTGTLELWRLDTGELLRSWSTAHQRVIRDLRFSPDGTRLASAAADHTVRLWDPLTGRQLAECRHEQGVHSVEFSPAGDRLLTASRDRSARLWNAATGQPIAQPMRHADSVNTARFSSDGRRVVTAADDGTVRIWEGFLGQPITAVAHGAEPVLEAAFRPCGHEVLIRRTTGGAEVRVPTLRQPLWQVSNLLPAPEPALLDASEHAAIERLHAGTLTFVDLSPDGRLVVTASSDHTATVFHRHNRIRLFEPLQHAAPVNCARFSPDGRRIVTSSADRSFRVWDTRTGMPLTDPIATDGPVAQVWFGDDGALVLTDSGRAWSIAQVQEPAPLWLPDLAEAVAGVCLDAQGAPEPVSAESFSLVAQAMDADLGPLGAWLKPFLGSALETWKILSSEPP